MNRSIQLFIFGFLYLLVLISGTSAACTPSANCDCNSANIAGCTGAGAAGLACGSQMGCALKNDVYQRDGKGNFCHFGPRDSCKAKGTP
ncbi:hypothetical protein C1645_794046 [Glomus cerebriforme]|uniref:Uncharacterized protein n=1 Tax=Glomus cerebriforme TaxID=658196 RepID=A0A397S111_9GLOM|nr:hypothetical protein C1645_794046 [Glomus cerebriforme]